jgi:hypothetical protein
MASSDVAIRWEALLRFVNGKPPMMGTVGVRDPDHPCEEFDGQHYDGTGDCMSDGHYMCTECSHLSPDAPRFEENFGRDGRRDRLLLFWSRKRKAPPDA